MPRLNSLREAYFESLRDAYDVEKQIVRELPKMIKGTETPQLRSALEHHLEQTKSQAQRLETIFETMGKETKPRKCIGLRGILEECEDTMREEADPAVRDAVLIASVQKVEHYEIALYGTLCTWAQQLGENTNVQLLRETLGEEKEADKKLTEIAESVVNTQAVKRRAAA